MTCPHGNAFPSCHVTPAQLAVAQHIADEFMNGRKVAGVMFTSPLTAVLRFADGTERSVTGKFAVDINRAKESTL